MTKKGAENGCERNSHQNHFTRGSERNHWMAGIAWHNRQLNRESCLFQYLFKGGLFFNHIFYFASAKRTYVSRPEISSKSSRISPQYNRSAYFQARIIAKRKRKLIFWRHSYAKFIKRQMKLFVCSYKLKRVGPSYYQHIASI